MGFKNPDATQVVQKRPDIKPVGFTDVIWPAIKRENLVVSAASYMIDNHDVDSTVDYEFDAFEAAEGTTLENYPASLIGVVNKDEFDVLLNRTEEEEKTLDMLDRAGIWGYAAAMVGGASDPIQWALPGFRAAKGLKVGGNVIAGLRAGARAGFVGAAVSEAGLLATQETRTYEEAALNIAAGTLLAGMFNAGANAIGARRMRGHVKAIMESDDAPLLAKALEDQMDMNVRNLNGSPEEAIPLSRFAFAKDTADELTDADILKSNTASMDELEKFLGDNLTLKGAGGLEKILGVQAGKGKVKGIFPGLRVMVGSHTRLGRKYFSDLFELSYKYQDDVVAAEGGAIETLAKLRETWVTNGSEGTVQSYKAYRKAFRARRKAGEKDVNMLTKAEFRDEVGRALSNKDKVRPGRPREVQQAKAQIEESAKIWRDQMYGKYTNDLIEVGRIKPDSDTLGQSSYFHRMWNRDAVENGLNANGESFDTVVDRYLRERHADFSPADIVRTRDSIKDNIVNGDSARLADPDYSPKGTSPLKSRRFDIENHLIDDFLINDVEIVSRHYHRTMAMDMELMKYGMRIGKPVDIGNLSSWKIFDDIRAEYDLKLEKLKTPEARTVLKVEREAVIDDILGSLEIARRRTGRTDGAVAALNESIRGLAVLSQGGGFGVISMTDVGRPIMEGGFLRTIGDTYGMFRNLKFVKADLAETDWGFRQLNSEMRYHDLLSIGDGNGQYSSLFRRGLKRSVDRFMIANGLGPWNATMKSWAGGMIHYRVARAMTRIMDGKKIPGKEMNWFAEHNISQRMLHDMVGMSERHGIKSGNVVMPNIAEWNGAAGADLRRAILAAVRKSIDRTIVTPTAADLPFTMVSNQNVKTMLMYRSFGLSMTNKALIPAMQSRHAGEWVGVMNGAFMMAAMGGLLGAFRTWQAGREIPDPLEHKAWWARESVDRSGIMYPVMEPLNMMDRMGMGPANVIDGPLTSRYIDRNTVGVFAGPAAGYVNNAVGAMSGIFQSAISDERDYTRGDLRRLRRMMPMQNLFWLQQGFNLLEEYIGDTLDLPYQGKSQGKVKSRP